MRDLIETLATITGLRDRLALMSAVTRLVGEVLQPETVTAWRRVSAQDIDEWLVLQHIGGRSGAQPAPQRLAQLPVKEPAWIEVEEQRHLHCPHTVFLALRSGRAIVGALEITTPGGLGTQQHRQLVAIVRMFAHLHGLIDENECDALTGLLNRKTFDAAFSRVAFGSADESLGADPSRDSDGHAWSLAVVDIDHFKRINDTHGHLIGDEVLLLLAQRMRATLRADDQIYRFGGEEFVVLLRTRDEAGALAALERLRRTVQTSDFPRVGSITLSLGFTQVRPEDTPSDAFGRADQAVYWVKQNGRNAVRSFEQLLTDGEIAAPEAAAGVEFF
jgi:diguanylate cyclase (GGDEF)-like protein